MTKIIYAKLAAAAAAMSTAILLSGCNTTAGKPVICKPGEVERAGRCAKVGKTSADKRVSGKAARNY
jgi:hypothetical protein